MKSISDLADFAVHAQKLLTNVHALTRAPEDLGALHLALAEAEALAIGLRIFYESNPRPLAATTKPPAPIPNYTGGRIEVNEYGWLHIELPMLLPHCRYETPPYLTDTLTKLLDGYGRYQELPKFGQAMLVIDEWSDIKNRSVFDQDNKGWKAIPNVLKGRVIEDDDQYHLSIALLSKEAPTPACHIYVLPDEEADSYFTLRAMGIDAIP